MNLRLISLLLLSVWFSSHFEAVLLIKNKINIELNDTDSEVEDEIEKDFILEKVDTYINPSNSYTFKKGFFGVHILSFYSETISNLLDPPERNK